MASITESDPGTPAAEEDRGGYDDEVLNAGWAEVPPEAPRPAAATPRGDDADTDAEAFLDRLYSAQGMVGR